MADLSHSRSKVERARRHEDAFFDAVEVLLADSPYSLTHGFEEDDWYVFRWRVAGEPDLSAFPLIYGDILSNLRAALDYAAWQLVLVNGQQPSERTAFPVVMEASTWAGAASRHLVGAAPEWVDTIRTVQPFNAERPERDLLGVLHRMNNINKHRLPQTAVAALASMGSQIQFEGDPTELRFRPAPISVAPIADGVEASRFGFDPPTPISVTVQDGRLVQVTFEDGLDHSDGWGYTNENLIGKVSRTLDLLEPAFA